jgi:MarR family 2-MHQ and catechol resistance regulon transcriptional repressor
LDEAVMISTGHPSSTEKAARESFLPVVRELVRTYQAFSAYDAAGYADVDLTVPQADVIFTLGNTQGLTCKQIGEKTLITKGTLTGILDRLEAKKLIRRVRLAEDRRSTRIQLTAAGERLFEREFPRQIAHLKERFRRLSQTQLREIHKALRTLREVL